MSEIYLSKEDAAQHLGVTPERFVQMGVPGSLPGDYGRVWPITKVYAAGIGLARAVKIAGVYFAKAGEFVKIGHSRHVLWRLSEIRSACPLEIELLRVIAARESDEAALHARFGCYRVRGEWFQWCGDIERYVGSHRRDCLLRKRLFPPILTFPADAETGPAACSWLSGPAAH